MLLCSLQVLLDRPLQAGSVNTQESKLLLKMLMWMQMIGVRISLSGYLALCFRILMRMAMHIQICMVTTQRQAGNELESLLGVGSLSGCVQTDATLRYFVLFGCRQLLIGQGRVCDFKRGVQGQEALKVQCFLHSKCSKFKRIALLPDAPDAKIYQWLVLGLSYPNRGDASEHLKE